MHKRILAVVTALVMILLAAGRPGWAAPQPQARSVITYPSSGMTISGLVEVTGIATHPNISSYQVRYAAGPEPTGDSQWVDFAIVQALQVEDGVLGTWDTTLVPDGQYTLALAVWGIDDAASPYVFFVTHLYLFAHGLYDRGMANAIFLRAEREPDGGRTFRISEGEPMQTSYGEDVYNSVFS